MRIQSSFAAAVAAAISAVVFSAAIQPAKATPIVIDDFTSAVSLSVGPTSVGNPFDSATTFGTFGGLTDRLAEIEISQQTSRGLRSGSFTVGSGTGTATITNSGTGTGVTDSQTALVSWSYGDFTPVDLTAGGNDRLQVVVGPTVPTGTLFQRYFFASDGVNSSGLFLGEWVAGETYEIPFSAFTDVDFSQIGRVGFGILNENQIPGLTPYNNTLTVTSFSAVPEPTQLVFVAGAGAILGAWRLRKLRRGRSAAGEAIAG